MNINYPDVIGFGKRNRLYRIATKLNERFIECEPCMKMRIESWEGNTHNLLRWVLQRWGFAAHGSGVLKLHILKSDGQHFWLRSKKNMKYSVYSVNKQLKQILCNCGAHANMNAKVGKDELLCSGLYQKKCVCEVKDSSPLTLSMMYYIDKNMVSGCKRRRRIEIIIDLTAVLTFVTNFFYWFSLDLSQNIWWFPRPMLTDRLRWFAFSLQSWEDSELYIRFVETKIKSHISPFYCTIPE